MHWLHQKWKTNYLLLFLILGVLGKSIPIQAKIDNGYPITSNESFFTTAIDYFELDPTTYRLIVSGDIYNPLNLSLGEIKALPVTFEIVRLTCIAYTYGGVGLTGVANWTGVRLSEILNLAEIKTEKAVDVIFRTPDHSPEGYSTSLSINEAYWNDVILAYEMNGVPLPVDHGFPIRLVCPRFYGYKWIKWLTHIEITSQDYLGFWESTGRYSDSPYVDDSLPVYYNYTITEDPSSNSTITKYYTSPPPLSTQTSGASSPWVRYELIILSLILGSSIFKKVK